MTSIFTFSPLTNQIFYLLESLKSVNPKFTHNFTKYLFSLQNIYKNNIVDCIRTMNSQMDFTIPFYILNNTINLNGSITIKYNNVNNFIIYNNENIIFGLINGVIKLYNIYYYSNNFFYNQDSICYAPDFNDFSTNIKGINYSIDYINQIFYYGNKSFDLKILE
jgi:hypothetical protein